jgi:hypothetical protein
VHHTDCGSGLRISPQIKINGFAYDVPTGLVTPVG